MKFTSGFVLVATSSQLALATEPLFGTIFSKDIDTLLKRTEYDVCQSNCSLHGIPFPDKNTLQLPLEKYYSERCPEIFIGKYDYPKETSTVCLDFTGRYLTFTFNPFPGYKTKSATVTWGLKGNPLYTVGYKPPPPSNAIQCTPEQDGTFLCKIPFNEIVHASNSADIKHLLEGMCPNGDREGLILYLQFSGTVVVPGSHKPIHFQQQYPCKPGGRDHHRKCTSYDCDYDYLEITYRCSKCQVAPCKPPCDTTTAYGYQSPKSSLDLDTQKGAGCKTNWGWYETPSIHDLRNGIHGHLYIQEQGKYYERVGSWTATLNQNKKLDVKFKITPGLKYIIEEVNIDFSCLPITHCQHEYFTYNKDGLGGLQEYDAHGIYYPSCGRHSRVYLIISAEVGTPEKPGHGGKPHDGNKSHYEGEITGKRPHGGKPPHDGYPPKDGKRHNEKPSHDEKPYGGKPPHDGKFPHYDK
ncbi:hypothetical protein QBC40DRAFT_327131 [Triangularia verruculosa]|uniref:Uncharacterized protein n=1 Tax=Triangularia verruculosa TaxID=2587418 RepID=A0AAN6XM27_9PEZI|nr:hypothetical protein QBC40DRAFT_327131 [Triangularia verruculosa]